MNRNYAIGKVGEKPRLLAFITYETALQQVQTGDVICEASALPDLTRDQESKIVAIDDGYDLALMPIAEPDGWIAIKRARNYLLDAWRWTIALDSPLTAECQAAFLSYLKALNRITVDYDDPADAVWPTVPELHYPV